MKKNIIIVMAIAAISFVACSSNKNVVTQPTQTPVQHGNVKVVLPCAQEGMDSDDYFAGMGIGENMNAQNARMAALNAAKSIINGKIGGLAKGLSTDYSRTMSGDARQNDVQGVVEREVTNVIERMLNDATQVCEELYQTPAGTYQSYIAIHISKKELASKAASALSDDQKLETLFNRDQFRKWAEQYMKEYGNNK
ncbi:MAG: hypothetical protein IJR13_01985 [Bacteroidales bacterium]|nr:hypothetical protein [Bacteroidales bacterium]